MADLLTIRDVLFWFALGLVALRVVYLWLRKGAERAEAGSDSAVVLPFNGPHVGAHVPRRDDPAGLHHLSVGVARHSLPQNYIHLVILDEWDDSMTKH